MSPLARARYLRSNVIAKTAAYTLTAADSGKTFTNLAATAGITFTLPTARANDNFHFICVVAYPMLVTAPAGVFIYQRGLKGLAAASTFLWQIGHSLRIICDGTDWYVTDDTTAMEGDDRYVAYDNFLIRPGINADRDVPSGNTYNTVQMQLGVDRSWNFEVVGTNSTSATVTTRTGGGLTLTTTSGANDQCVVTPHLNSAVSGWQGTNWATDDSVYFRTTARVGGSVASIIGWAGLKTTLTDVGITDNDQAFFRFENAVTSGDWVTWTSISGTDTTTDSAVVSAINTYYTFEILISPDRIARLFMNRVLIYTTAALATGINFIPYLGVRGATKVMNFRDLYMSKVRA